MELQIYHNLKLNETTFVSGEQEIAQGVMSLLFSVEEYDRSITIGNNESV